MYVKVYNADGSEAEHADKLFVSHGVDRVILKQRIHDSLKRHKQVSLSDVVEESGGLEKGLAELFGYISVIRGFRHTINPDRTQVIPFNSELKKSIVIPEIIILK